MGCFAKSGHRYASLTASTSIAAVLAVFLTATSVSASPVKQVQRIVEKLMVDTARDRSALEKTFSFRLEPDEGTSVFSFWRADQVVIEGLRIDSVSYRQPYPNSGATAGSLLILTFAETACADRTALLAQFPAMVLGAPPSPHDPDPELYYSQHTEEAELTFGFPLRQPKCLHKIIYSLSVP